MGNDEVYYALTLTAQGMSNAAYFSVAPTSNLTISQGGVTIGATAAATTFVSIYPNELQIQAAPGLISGGVTIVTSENHVAGRLEVSPPINVAAVLTFYGAGGQQLGQFILDPGSASGVFDFNTGGGGMLAGEALDVVKQKSGKN
jgi:hypothetical protein